jgi:hypothetical protein
MRVGKLVETSRCRRSRTPASGHSRSGSMADTSIRQPAVEARASIHSTISVCVGSWATAGIGDNETDSRFFAEGI